VALSPTGHEGAKLNGSEIAGWNFEKSKASRSYGTISYQKLKSQKVVR
jgi:hypothetical protein